MNLGTLNIKNYIKQEMLDVINQLFKKFDKSESGFILSKDLGTMLRLLEFNPTDKEINNMLQTLDIKEDKLTKEEFLTCVARKSRDSDTIDEFLNAFKIFDTENKGVIEEKVLRYVLCKTGDCFTDEEMDLLMKEAIPFTIVMSDTKYIKYTEFAMFLKDLYKPPPVDDGKKKKKK